MVAEAVIAVQTAYYGANLLKLGTEFYKKFKRVPSGPEGGEIKAQAKRAAETAVVNLPDDDGKMSSSIIRVLNQQVQKTNQAIEDCYEDSGKFLLEMGSNTGRLNYQLCHFVNEMKKFNGGKLPDFIVGVWNDICCEDGDPKYKSLR